MVLALEAVSFPQVKSRHKFVPFHHGRIDDQPTQIDRYSTPRFRHGIHHATNEGR